MSTFNAVGGVIFGTILLIVVWIVVMSFVKEQNKDSSNTDITWVVVVSFIGMLILCLSKCS